MGIATHIVKSQGTDPQPAAGARSPSEQVRELASIPPGATTEELMLRLLSGTMAQVWDCCKRIFIINNLNLARS